MISVGLDIGRLGLMLVQGQPKTAAEYIQATSRVGRLAERPGLILALLNAHKPRDRMHHEGFRQFHSCFYRAVEATSVTPWAARALDRALAAIVVAAGRHLRPDMTPDDAVVRIRDDSFLQDQIVEVIAARAPGEEIAGGIAGLRKDVRELLTAWIDTAEESTGSGGKLYYGYPRERALLHDPLDPLIDSLSRQHKRFTASHSMRDVEHTTPLRIVDPHGNVLS
jgi:hypothetical protein